MSPPSASPLLVPCLTVTGVIPPGKHAQKENAAQKWTPKTAKISESRLIIPSAFRVAGDLPPVSGSKRLPRLISLSDFRPGLLECSPGCKITNKTETHETTKRRTLQQLQELEQQKRMHGWRLLFKFNGNFWILRFLRSKEQIKPRPGNSDRLPGCKLQKIAL